MLKNSKGQGLKLWPFLCPVLMPEISERQEFLALAEPIVLPRSRDEQGLRVHRIQMAEGVNKFNIFNGLLIFWSALSEGEKASWAGLDLIGLNDCSALVLRNSA